MRRLWLLAALLSLLLPVPAAASTCAPPSGDDQYASAPVQDVGDQVRAGLGFELHTAREENRSGSLRGNGQPDRGTAGFPAALLAASAIRAPALPTPEGATPLCEHLPYHATAPPHRG